MALACREAYLSHQSSYDLVLQQFRPGTRTRWGTVRGKDSACITDTNAAAITGYSWDVLKNDPTVLHANEQRAGNRLTLPLMVIDPRERPCVNNDLSPCPNCPIEWGRCWRGPNPELTSQFTVSPCRVPGTSAQSLCVILLYLCCSLAKLPAPLTFKYTAHGNGPRDAAGAHTCIEAPSRTFTC